MSLGYTLDNAEAMTEKDVVRDFTRKTALSTPVTSTIGARPGQLAPVRWYGVEDWPDIDIAGAMEGVTLADSDFKTTNGDAALLGSRFIKHLEGVGVTKEQQLMHNQYDVKDKRNYMVKQIMTFSKVVLQKVEKFSMSDTESVAPAKGTVASSARSILRWISNADGRFTDTPTTPVAKWRTPADSILTSKAAATDITEPEIGAMITSVATARKEAGLRFMGMCSPTMRDHFDSMSKTDKSGTSTESYPVYRFSQTQGTIDRTITKYKSSNGTIELDTTFWMDSGCHFALLSPDFIKKSYAQTLKVSDEGADSQKTKKVIDVIWSLDVIPWAHGKAITGATA